MLLFVSPGRAHISRFKIKKSFEFRHVKCHLLFLSARSPVICLPCFGEESKVDTIVHRSIKYQIYYNVDVVKMNPMM